MKIPHKPFKFDMKKIKEAGIKLKEYEDSHITLEEILIDLTYAVEYNKGFKEIRDKIKTYFKNL